MIKTKIRKKYFCMIVSFAGIKQYIDQKEYFINKVSNSFDEFYLINSEKLEYLSKKEEIDLKEIKKLLPTNCKIFDAINSSDFLNFCKNKELIIWCNIGRLWRFFRIHYLLKKINAKLIYIHEIGMSNSSPIHSVKSTLVRFFFYKLPHKVVIFLSILNIFPKIDLRFLSIKNHYDKAINSFFYKISKKFKYLNFFYTRDFELINSISYDYFRSNNSEVTEEKIVFVDTNINHHDTIKEGDGVNDETFDKCYKDLEIYLKMLSDKFKKPVVICVHPSVNINRIKNLLKDFEIVKYQTKENIYKSFIVLFYNSSAIVYALFLKKRIITIENKRMGESWVKAVSLYPDKVGLLKIDIQKENKILDKDLFLKKMDDITKSDKYNNFISGFLESDTSGMVGSDKIINIIKKRYFN